MAERVDVLWRCDELASAEHFVLRSDGDGWSLSGDVVLLVGDIPAHVTYRVGVSRDWRPAETVIDFHVGGARDHLEIARLDGHWTVDGTLRPELAGCTDIDLGWTPATNTIPLRRLADTDGEGEVRAAWVNLPDFEIRAVTQTYERVGSHRWRYSAGRVGYVLEVSDEGLVVSYGEGLWSAERVVRAGT